MYKFGEEGYIDPNHRFRNPSPQARWISNIMGSTKLDLEYGDCPNCGKTGIEFTVWRLRDGTIKKYADCSDCTAKDEAKIQEEENTAHLAEIARVRRQVRQASGIPAKFMDQDFSTFQKGWQDKALKTCVDYAESFPVDKFPRGYRSLYLWSDTSWGTGKTHLSCAILHRILDRWTGDLDKGCPRVVFLSEPDLFRQIQATYSFTNEEKRMRESEDDIIKRLIWADLLVLDDVAKEKRSDLTYLQRIMFGIIDGRYKNDLPVVVTGNVTTNGLKEHWGNATYDRFWEQVKGKATRMDGKSFRRRS